MEDKEGLERCRGLREEDEEEEEEGRRTSRRRFAPGAHELRKDS